MEPMFETIKANLFPACHAAIRDWDKFPWHKYKGQIQADKPWSSQALAIDVFGTIKVSKERDHILGELAQRCGVPSDGPWTLELEWIDPDNLLCELKTSPTQVDAIAFGQRALLVIECKFKEPSGACSQPTPIKEGRNKGLPQCSGDYALQTNPANGKSSRCALTGKGVQYWNTIPRIYGLDAEADHRPCAFKGEAYQWMRNVVLADSLAAARGVSWAVIAAYAEADGLATAEKARSGLLGHAPASGAKLVVPLSYQSIVLWLDRCDVSLLKPLGEWSAMPSWGCPSIQTHGMSWPSG